MCCVCYVCYVVCYVCMVSTNLPASQPASRPPRAPNSPENVTFLQFPSISTNVPSKSFQFLTFPVTFLPVPLTCQPGGFSLWKYTCLATPSQPGSSVRIPIRFDRSLPLAPPNPTVKQSATAKPSAPGFNPFKKEEVMRGNLPPAMPR